MKNKFQINDDVEVRFYGKIKGISSHGNKILYDVHSGGVLDFKAQAEYLTENQLFTLPTEEGKCSNK